MYYFIVIYSNSEASQTYANPDVIRYLGQGFPDVYFNLFYTCLLIPKAFETCTARNCNRKDLDELHNSYYRYNIQCCWKYLNEDGDVERKTRFKYHEFCHRHDHEPGTHRRHNLFCFITYLPGSRP